MIPSLAERSRVMSWLPGGGPPRRGGDYYAWLDQAVGIVEGMAPREWEGIVKERGSAPLYATLPDGSWRGEAAFIIGGGPSLTGFDFTRLKGRRVIAVNRAFEVARFADILFSMDSLYYRWALMRPSHSFSKFKGLKVWLDTYGFPYQGIHLVKSQGEKGLSWSLRDGLYHGRNSGYAALNLAACLGANPIYLMGFDMAVRDGKTHFHSGYSMAFPVRKLPIYAERFNQAAPMLKARNINVVNLSPSSALECFPKYAVDEVLT